MHQRREEYHGHAQKEQQQAELAHATLYGQAQRLQAQGVARQPHHIEDAQGAQHAQDEAQLVQITSAAAATTRGFVLQCVVVVDHQRDVVRKDGHNVDYVEWPAGKGQLAACLDEAEHKLQREPDHTDGLYYKHELTLLRTLTLCKRKKNRVILKTSRT